MERVVEKLQVVRPLILREIVQTVDKTSEVAVSEKTERAGDFDRIIEPLRGDIRLTNERDTRHWSAFELSFHRRERDRLMIADHLGLRIAGGKGNQQRCDQSNERSSAQIKSRLNPMKSSERIKSAYRGDNERAGHNRGQLIMRELHERPRIQQIGAHAGDA